jgi:hypothetical protein
VNRRASGRVAAPLVAICLALALLLPGAARAAEEWGPPLAPLASDYFVFSDPGGRYTARIPNAWSNRQDVSPNSVIFRQPGPLWGAELALNDGSAFTSVEQADAVINQQVSQRPNYRLISLDKVMVGPFNAFRRVFEHTNDEGQQEIIVRIYFLSGPWLYNVNGFMLPPDYAQVAPLVDGIAGSITVIGAPPPASPSPSPVPSASPSPAPPSASPSPSAPSSPRPTAPPTAPPSPPSTGSGGNLPNLPNTGAGGGTGGSPLLAVVPIVALLGLAFRLRATRRRT